MIIEITDGTTPMLLAIKAVSREVAYEVMSKVGNRVRENAKKHMSSTRNRHHWLQRSSKGKLVPYKSKTETKELGERTTKSGSVDNPRSMGNMITSNLMEESGVVIVGGKNRKKRVVYRKDGEITGYGKLDAVSKHTQSIIHKLDTGQRNEFHGWGSGGILKTSPHFENATYRGRNFMVKGFGESIPYMKSELSSGYEKTIGRAINKVSVKIKPSVRKVS